jgi:hypothetical protein
MSWSLVISTNFIQLPLRQVTRFRFEIQYSPVKMLAKSSI